MNFIGTNEIYSSLGVESIIKNNSIKLLEFKSSNADGCQVRDFLDVDKAVEIMVYLSEKSCEFIM